MASKPSKKPMAAAAAISAGALLIATPLIGGWEGLRTTPYKDIVGVATVCYGETRVPMRKYSVEECEDMLTNAVEHDFMEPVAEMTPTIRDRPYKLAAATSLAYNIGINAYRNSTVRKLFNQEKFTEACNGFAAWNKVRRAGVLVASNGLTNRRKDEIKICLTEDSPPSIEEYVITSSFVSFSLWASQLLVGTQLT